MNLKYSKEEKDAWEHLYLLGYSSLEISKLRGVTSSSVKKFIASLGIQRSFSQAHKGRTPWNKGLTGVQEAWNKGTSGLYSSPNKGKPSKMRGVPRSEKTKEKIKLSWRSRLESGWNNFGGYGRAPNSEQRLSPAILYLIRYLDESGVHFKIGITKRKLSERFPPEKLVSVIHTWNFPLGKCFDLEQAALRYALQHGYRYASPTTTELIRPEGVVSILEFIEQSLDDDDHLAEFTIS
jgi:hypothetical protein